MRIRYCKFRYCNTVMEIDGNIISFYPMSGGKVRLQSIGFCHYYLDSGANQPLKRLLTQTISNPATVGINADHIQDIQEVVRALDIWRNIQSPIDIISFLRYTLDPEAKNLVDYNYG